MAADPGVLKRLAGHDQELVKLKARVLALEVRLSEAKSLVKLDGSVIDIEGEWAIKRCMEILAELAPLCQGPGNTPEINEDASQAIDLLQSLGFMPRGL